MKLNQNKYIKCIFFLISETQQATQMGIQIFVI